MHNLPNIITSIRLLCALVLIVECFCGSAPQHFLLLFIAAAVSDMLDGYIARRFEWCTEFGANLDSISDLCLYLSVVLFFSIYAKSSVCHAIAYIAIGLLTQAAHLTFAFRKHGEFPAYHSDYSRICAYICGIGTVAFWTLHLSEILPCLAIIWTSCSIEGLVITKILKRPVTNVANIPVAMKMYRQQLLQDMMVRR